MGVICWFFILAIIRMLRKGLISLIHPSKSLGMVTGLVRGTAPP